MSDNRYIPFNGRQPGEDDESYANRRAEYISEQKAALNENVQQQRDQGRDDSSTDIYIKSENKKAGKGLFSWFFGNLDEPTQQQSFATDEELNQERASKDLGPPAPEVSNSEPGTGEWYLDDDGLMKRR